MKTITIFALFLTFLSVGHPTADADLVTVAFTGDNAPGTSDNFTNLFGTPVLNNAGQTAFVGVLSSSSNTTNFGIWSEGGGSGLALVARAGSAAPGTSDNFTNLFGTPVLNNVGQTAFLGLLNSSSGTDDGIWSEGGGSGLALVARAGSPAPGTSDNFMSFLLNPVLNNAGQTAFFGGLNSSSGTDGGIWSEGGGSGLALVAREGSTAPGTSDSFSSFNSNPVLNNAGQTAFRGSLTTDGGIWSEGGGSGLALVARAGSTAPGTSDNFTGLFGIPVLNSAGQTAFFGNLNSSSTTDRGIWSEGGGSGLALVARAGSPAPGTGDNFSSFLNPVLNNAGQTAFLGGLTTDSGIWSEGGGSGLALVARAGNTAPGTSDNFSFFEHPVLNNAGQTAFFGDLNSSSSSTDRGIWAEDPSGVLTLVAREGDLLDVNDGPGTDFRTISFLDFFADTGNGDGRRSGFNDLGQLVFRASFTDGTRGIFLSDLVAQLPDPADFDNDGDVDGSDFLAWQRNPSVGNLSDWESAYGSGTLPGSADFDNDGDVDGNDFLAWQRNPSVGNLSDWENAYGSGTLAAATTVPEPTSVVLGAFGVFGLLATRGRKK